tara:strand:+ start:1323 stop:1523 length:201 start_codon:yes stop_codon:yes gene_type:complete
MKIYTLTIGIDEENEEVEFIKEEQFNIDDVNIVSYPEAAELAAEEDTFENWLKQVMKLNFNIIGRA